jgi:hypothetical protein
MAKYLRHFLEDAIGASPGGVGASKTAGVSYVLAGSLPNGVGQDAKRFLGDRAAEAFVIGAGGSKLRGGLGLDAVNADANRADIEIRGTIQIASNGSGTGTGASAGARVTGSSTSWTGYFADFRASANTIAIVKGSAGADTDLNTGAFTFTTTGLYSFVFRVTGTSTVTLSLKIWDESTPEPTSWTITASDSTSPIAGPGSSFIGAITAASGVYAQLVIWYLSIATAGDNSPPRPVSWQEYLDYLELQDTLRCVLMEFSVLGQDNTGAGLEGLIAVSNYPFVSKPEDTIYPNICYEELLVQAPQIHRRMGAAYSGQTSMSYGDALIKNEVVDSNLPEYKVENFTGRLDAWLSWNWDGRNARMLLGHPRWRRSDFKTLFRGTTQDIYKAAYGRLGIKLKGPEGLAQKPLTTSLIGGSGPNANALRPLSLANNFFNAEGILYDAPTLAYQLQAPTSGNAFFFNEYLTSHAVRDSGISLKQAARTITSVNAGTDTLTLDAAHGLSVNATCTFTGSLPAGISVGAKYYVKTVPSGTTLTLSTSSGGPTLDITGTTTGGVMLGFLYDWDTNGRIYLLSTPAGRVTADMLPNGSTAQVSGAVKQAIIFAGVAIPTNVDIFHGQTLTQVVVTFNTSQVNLGQVLDSICMSVGASWCFTREGTYYLTVLDVPGAVSAWTYVADDIRNWRGGQRTLPQFVERLGYLPNPTIQQGGDLAGSVSASDRDLYGKPYTLTNYTPSEAGLEQPANHLLAVVPPQRGTLLSQAADAATETQRLYNFYRKVTGTYLFDTHARGLAAELGDIVNITYPRDGFQNGRNAVIVGITENADRGKVELEVFCQIDGQWPLVAAAQPYITEAYF